MKTFLLINGPGDKVELFTQMQMAILATTERVGRDHVHSKVRVPLNAKSNTSKQHKIDQLEQRYTN